MKEFIQNNSGNCSAPAALYTKYSLWKMCQHHLHWIKSHVREHIKAWKSACIKKPKAWSHPKHLQTIRESHTKLLRSADGWRGSTISSQTPSAAAIFSRSCFQTVQTLTFLGENAIAQCWKSCLIQSLSACQVYMFLHGSKSGVIHPIWVRDKIYEGTFSAQILQVWEQLALGMGT